MHMRVANLLLDDRIERRHVRVGHDRESKITHCKKSILYKHRPPFHTTSLIVFVTGDGKVVFHSTFVCMQYHVKGGINFSLPD